MYGRTNADGDVKASAFIFATYPVGSTCTATDGSRTLKLKDMSGYGIFYVPYAATWTVTATDGVETTSSTVEITKEGQAESVVLSYTLWLFKDGNQYTGITGGWSGDSFSYYGYAKGTITAGNVLSCTTSSSSQIAYIGTNNKVDLTHINTLYFDVRTAASAGLYISDGYNVATANFAAQKSATVGTNSLDVTNVTGEWIVFVGGRSSEAVPNIRIEVAEIWGE